MHVTRDSHSYGDNHDEVTKDVNFSWQSQISQICTHGIIFLIMPQSDVTFANFWFLSVCILTCWENVAMYNMLYQNYGKL